MIKLADGVGEGCYDIPSLDDFLNYHEYYSFNVLGI